MVSRPIQAHQRFASLPAVQRSGVHDLLLPRRPSVRRSLPLVHTSAAVRRATNRDGTVSVGPDSGEPYARDWKYPASTRSRTTTVKRAYAPLRAPVVRHSPAPASARLMASVWQDAWARCRLSQRAGRTAGVQACLHTLHLAAARCNGESPDLQHVSVSCGSLQLDERDF
jgi:hypothetical protein